MPTSPHATPLSVQGATYSRIHFSSDAPHGVSLCVDYLENEELLARENRPLASGSRSVDIKTHPDSTHIVCTFDPAATDNWNPALTVDSGDLIEPIARHFIVIGAMKAGTTTFFRMMKQHPAICRTHVEVPGKSFTKEINYFRKLYRPNDMPIHYDWRFPFRPETHAWTFDVSTNYAKLPGSRPVAERMAALGANIKIVYILREPVDRIESQIAHAMREDRGSASETHCIRVSRYAAHLDNFLRHFSPNDILLLDFEQLQNDPAAMQSRVCEFLGIQTIRTVPGVHNQRTVKFKLSDDDREKFIKALRPDVDRMITDYEFEPAREWLRPPRKSWFRRFQLARP